MDAANLLVGAVSVPLFRGDLPQRHLTLMRRAQAELIFVEGPKELQAIIEMREQLAGVRKVVVIDETAVIGHGEVLRVSEMLTPESRDWVISLDRLEQLGRSALENNESELMHRRARINSDTVAAIAFTPGTESAPKGVVQTHGNFIAAAEMLGAALELDSSDLQLLYLPFSHVFGRTCLFVSVYTGGTVAFARRYQTFEEDARLVEPSFFCSVPRLFEKIGVELLGETESRSVIEKWVSRWARREEEQETGGLIGSIKKRLADTLRVNPLRDVLGPNIRFAISGGARLNASLGQYLEDNGLTILEGYGMAETTAASYINRLGSHRYGSVGQPLTGQQELLLEDGQVLLKGPHLCPGLLKEDGSIVDILDHDGWFRTGDIGSMSEDGYLSIVDRKRNIILTATGKVIAPERISEAIRAERIIDQTILYGDGRPFITALIWLDRVALAEFATEKGLEGDTEFLLRHPITYAQVEACIEAVNAELASYERVKKFAIMEREPSVEDGEVTQTKAMRRKVTAERNRTLLDSFYSEEY